MNSKGTHWVSLFINKNVAIYFDSLGIEYIPQEVLNKMTYKWIPDNTFRIQYIKIKDKYGKKSKSRG